MVLFGNSMWWYVSHVKARSIELSGSSTESALHKMQRTFLRPATVARVPMWSRKFLVISTA